MSPEAIELDLAIHNDYQLWKQHEAIEAMMVKKIVGGTYKSDLAVKGWLNLVERAARQYSKDSGASNNIFTPAMRREVAVQLERRFYQKHMGMKKKNAQAGNIAFMMGPGGQRIMEKSLASRRGCEFCGGTDHASDDHMAD